MRLSEILEGYKRVDKSTDEFKEAIKLYIDGYATNKIESLTGVDESTLLKYMRKLPDWAEIKSTHFANSKFFLELTDEQLAQAGEMYATGKSVASICKFLGYADDSGSTHILPKLKTLPDWEELSQQRKLSLVHPTVGLNKNFTPEQKAEMVKMFVSGMNLVQIGKEFGVSNSAIGYIFKKLPNYQELKDKHRASKAAAQTQIIKKIYRAGEIGNLRSQGPGNKNIRGRLVGKFE